MTRAILALALLALTAFASEASAGQRRIVAAEKGLSLRAKADTSSDRVQMLLPCEVVDVVKVQGEWANVKATSGKTGWVLSSYLSPTAYVSSASDELNVRIGPGSNHDVKFTVGKGYPLLVLDRTEDWIKVEDVDGDVGWTSRNLVSFKPHVVTKLDKCNVRREPGTEAPIVFTAERLVILEVLKERDGWLNVKHSDGDTGWISAKIVFGWLDPQ